MSRMTRLRNILRYYLPHENQQNIKTTVKPGQLFTEAVYDKVKQK